MNTDKNDNKTLKSVVSYDIINTVAEECSALACVQSFAVNIYALGTQRAKQYFLRKRVIIMASKSKKVFALLLTSVMAASALAGCGGSSEPTGASKAPGTTTSTTSSTGSTDVTNININDPDTKAKIIDQMKKEADQNGGKISLKVWCATNDFEFEKARCEAFKNDFLGSNPGFTIDINVRNAIGEPDAGGKIVEQKEKGADVFNFADDQVSMMLDAGAIAQVPTIYKGLVSSNNSTDSIAAATLNDKLLAYPKSSDNGYFLYYDNRVLSEDDVKDFDTMIAKSKEKNKEVFMNFGDAWYATGFFFTAGVKIEYKNDVQTATFDTPEGLKAVKAMCHIAENTENGFEGNPGTVGNNSFVEQGFKDGKLSAAVIGTWEGIQLKQIVGADNLSAAKLPTVLMDGKQEQLHSFGGYKLVGVSNYSKFAFSAHTLAYFLTDETSQVARYKERGLLPTNNAASDTEVEVDGKKFKISEDVACKALADQKPFAHPQGTTVSGKYWGIGVGTLGGDIVAQKGNMDEATLQRRLKDMQDNLK